MAKRDFIEDNYDYTTTATEMNLEIFKNIMQSNNEVNETVQGFVERATTVKKDTQRILAQRYDTF